MKSQHGNHDCDVFSSTFHYYLSKSTLALIYYAPVSVSPISSHSSSSVSDCPFFFENYPFIFSIFITEFKGILIFWLSFINTLFSSTYLLSGGFPVCFINQLFVAVIKYLRGRDLFWLLVLEVLFYVCSVPGQGDRA